MRLFIFSFLFIFNIGNFLLAQEQGNIKGRIVDKLTKQPLVGANVFLTETTIGAMTNSEGFFVIENVEENVYKLQVQYIGYNTFLKTDVRVVRSKTTFLNDIELLESIESTEAITISAGYFREDDHAPVSAHSYSRQEIYRSPGAAGDVFRAIETLPGVSTSGGEFSAFSVRSGSPKENIILIDNIPFDKVSHFTGGSEEQEKLGGRFSIFAPNLIEEANFQAGGFSAVYGGKNASVLDLKIKEGNIEDMTVDGRFDITGWEVNYNGPLSPLKNTSAVFSARHTNFTNILEWTGQDDFGRPRFDDFILKITSWFNPNHKISLLGIYTPEFFDKEVKHVFKSDEFASNDLSDYEETKSMMGLNWQYLTGKKSVLQSSFYYRTTDRDASIGEATATILTPQSESDFKTRTRLGEKKKESESGLRSVFTWSPLHYFSLTTGFEASQLTIDYQRRQEGLDTLYFYDQDDFRPNVSQKYLITSPEFINADFDDRKSLYASFIEVSYKPILPFTINAGLRYEHNEFNNKHYFAPRFSTAYKLNPKTRISLATGIYYQTPELEVVVLSPQNNDLKNEKATHFIAGLTHYLADDVKFTVEGYYKEFDDLFIRPDRINQVYTNAGDGWARGIDFSVVKKFVDRFYGQVVYSYSESKRNDHNGEGNYNSDFNQPHIFNILVGYEFNKEWSISAKWRYATGRPKDSFIIHKDIFNDPNFLRYSKEIISDNTDRLSDFHTFNIRVDYRKQIGPIALVSFVDIVNVYNHLNVNEDRFLQLNGKEDQRGFGILPTGGIKIEF